MEGVGEVSSGSKRMCCPSPRFQAHPTVTTTTGPRRWARLAQATQELRGEFKSEEVKPGLGVLTLRVPSAAGD